MSGLECAGLVLAVLPLFISAVDAYSKGTDMLWGVLIRSRANNALHDFYCEFYYQIATLQKNLEQITSSLAGNVSASRNQVSFTSQLGALEGTSAPQRSLATSLGSDVSFRLFETISTKIVKLLGQLLREQKGNRKALGKDSHTDNERLMFDRLKELAADIKSQKTKSTFAERFRFFKDKKDRDVCLKNLGIWNKRLGKLVLDAGDRHGLAPIQDNAHSHGQLLNNPFFRSLISSPGIVSEVTRDLYAALFNCWGCDCPAGHEARLCLNVEHALEQVDADIPVTFDMLVSMANGQQSNIWREGTVCFKFPNKHRQSADTRLRSLCDSLDIGVGGYRLRILIEHMTENQTVWKLEPKPKRLCFLETEDPVPLHGLLDNHCMMSRIEKCGLGLIVTYSLLLFYDSPWNTLPWDKNKLSFFHKAADEPDYLRPFITTRFEEGNTEVGQPCGTVFHRNYNIMMLGILLIEIFMQSRIERFRTKQEREETTPNTEANVNLKVACRVVGKMDDTPHRAAIWACLNLDWFPEGQRVLLEDLEVRKALLTNVIEPLKREQELAS